MKRIWNHFMQWGQRQRMQYHSDFCALVIALVFIFFGGFLMWDVTSTRIVLTIYAGCIAVLMLPAIVGRWPEAFQGAVRNPEEVRKARSSVYTHLAIAAFHALGFLSGLLLLFLR